MFVTFYWVIFGRRGWFVVDCGSSWTDVQFILVVVDGSGW